MSIERIRKRLGTIESREMSRGCRCAEISNMTDEELKKLIRSALSDLIPEDEKLTMALCADCRQLLLGWSQ